jgi:hypothetical protein
VESEEDVCPSRLGYVLLVKCCALGLQAIPENTIANTI